jgi:hypothetical protein
MGIIIQLGKAIKTLARTRLIQMEKEISIVNELFPSEKLAATASGKLFNDLLNSSVKAKPFRFGRFLIGKFLFDSMS